MTRHRIDDLCRSERYFTAALLGGLLYANNDEGVCRFLEWLGTKGIQADGKPLIQDRPAWLEVVMELNFKRDLKFYDAPTLGTLLEALNADDKDNMSAVRRHLNIQHIHGPSTCPRSVIF